MSSELLGYPRIQNYTRPEDPYTQGVEDGLVAALEWLKDLRKKGWEKEETFSLNEAIFAFEFMFHRQQSGD